MRLSKSVIIATTKKIADLASFCEGRRKKKASHVDISIVCRCISPLCARLCRATAQGDCLGRRKLYIRVT